MHASQEPSHVQPWSGCPVVPVVVASGRTQGLGVADALAAGNIRVAEVTFRVDGAAEAIRAVAEERPEMVVAAGTVINTDQVDVAVDAGAQFLVSPGLNRSVIERAHEHDVPVIPGVASPSDIMAALELGITTVKLFPAVPLGGIAILRAFAAPFPQVRFVPTGGIGIDTAADWLRESAVDAVGGSWMVPPSKIADQDWDAISRLSAATWEQLAAEVEGAVR
ncbi:bifunctional 4-hydroxy-2-oxoglutarate aldolase/2-dehydro-3-deoxy-phosphogluconate aldolase [Demequina rhizosphaerae]|uniref:bifunctional 4-hydroxy-2-oxoglutarate aldolase/2-dehydro-3-deoxy-phosphogluconate aldolase n=1 Tax=Demequina rhizosphaerae TaxID=1638985 RepID=UPI0007819B14|nr:bifunctional 4-hydroxy-2-oxoglutarate aldolase/2-dehydro-3-deoxy-phosphogluconate aldolase [Demequina rhizosphaerae]